MQIDIKTQDYGSQFVFEIQVDITKVGVLLNELLDIKNKGYLILFNNQTTVKLTLSEPNIEVSRCLSLNKDTKKVLLSITNDSYQYFLNYIDEYSKNKKAKVPHLDLDFKFIKDYEVTITIKAKEYIPLMSSKEINKKLRRSAW